MHRIHREINRMDDKLGRSHFRRKFGLLRGKEDEEIEGKLYHFRSEKHLNLHKAF